MTMPAEKQDLINGLPVSALQETAAALADAPEQGLLSFETTSEWLGGARTRTYVDGFVMGGQRIERRHVIEADEPKEVFGGDEAANPQELLLAAIGSCMAAMWAVHAALAGVRLRSLEIRLRGTLDMRGPLELADVPRGFPELSCTVNVDGDATPAQLQAIHETVQRTSPNFYHITTAIPTRAKLVVQG
jgi:uncharacterized OsmC-like protein